MKRGHLEQTYLADRDSKEAQDAKQAIIADYMNKRINTKASQSDEELHQAVQPMQPFQRMKTPVNIIPLDHDLNDRMRRNIETMEANNVEFGKRGQQ